MCIVAVTRASQWPDAQGERIVCFIQPSTRTRPNWVLRFFIAGASRFVLGPLATASWVRLFRF